MFTYPNVLSKRVLSTPYSIILFSWVLLVALVRFWPTILLVGTVIAFTALLPFLMMFVWLARSNLGKKGAKLLEKWYWKASVGVILFVYAVLAKQWAAVTINQIFKVDASYFSITSAAVAVLYLPLQSLYNVAVLVSLWNILVGFSVIWIFYSGFLVITTGFRKALKVAIAGIIFGFLINFFFSVVFSTVQNRDIVITRFALWADFNSEHLCTGAWTEQVDSVLFLSGDIVLAHFPRPVAGQSFIPFHCDYARALSLSPRSTSSTRNPFRTETEN